jgi:hypothetical protein
MSDPNASFGQTFNPKVEFEIACIPKGLSWQLCEEMFTPHTRTGFPFRGFKGFRVPPVKSEVVITAQETGYSSSERTIS